MKKITIILTLCFLILTASAQTNNDKMYDGKIGDFNIKVNINFRNAVDAEESDSIGYYYYTDRPKTKFTLRLKEFDEKMNEKTFKVSYHFIITEHTPKGFCSGTFDGWTSALNCYNGTFTNSQGKEYDFMWDVLTVDE